MFVEYYNPIFTKISKWEGLTTQIVKSLGGLLSKRICGWTWLGLCIFNKMLMVKQSIVGLTLQLFETTRVRPIQPCYISSFHCLSAGSKFIQMGCCCFIPSESIIKEDNFTFKHFQPRAYSLHLPLHPGWKKVRRWIH